MTRKMDTAAMLYARAQFYECEIFDDYVEQLRKKKLAIGMIWPPGSGISRAKVLRKFDEARKLFGDSEALEWLYEQTKYTPREDKETNR